MKTARWTALALMIALSLGTVAALAGDAPPAQASKKEAAAETAAYSAPKLLEGTLIQDLGKALADKPGILSATVDKEKGHFKVTFEPGKTNPDEILKALAAVNKDVKFEGVTAADPKAAKHDCGKCPMSKACSKKK